MISVKTALEYIIWKEKLQKIQEEKYLMVKEQRYDFAANLRNEEEELLEQKPTVLTIEELQELYNFLY